MHVSANTTLTDDRSRIDSSRLRAIMGMNTLSSKSPCAPPKATAASLPITWAPTWVTASGITGLTLPGMIELPGCRSGRRISPRPVRGPLPIQRRSLAILIRATAERAQLAAGLDQRIAGALGGEMVARPREAAARCVPTSRAITCGEALGRVDAGPTAVPPERQLATRAAVAQARDALLDLGGVAAELLARA